MRRDVMRRDMVLRDMMRRWSKATLYHVTPYHVTRYHVTQHPVTLLKLDDRPTLDLPLEHALEVARQVVERNDAGDLVQVSRLQVRGEPAPHLPPQRHGRVARVDADETHPAQNERQHRGLELDAARVAVSGNEPVRLHGARQPGELLAAHGVESGRP